MPLPYISDWRWMTNRDDTLWYPTMRLFRQHRFGDWDELFTRLARELSAAPFFILRGCFSCHVDDDQQPAGFRRGRVFTAGDYTGRGAGMPRNAGMGPRHWRGLVRPGRGQPASGQGCRVGELAIATRCGSAPGNAEAWNNLGASLSTLRRPEEAEPCLRRALEIEPGYAQAHNNLGNALQALGRFDEALESYHRALHFKPDYSKFTNMWAWSCSARDGWPRPSTGSPRPWSGLPSLGAVHMNYALTCLQRGDFARGWTEYEWRFRCREHPVLAQGIPPWDGSPLDGRRILLWAEQGLGDTIQFIRYAPAVAQRGGRVIVTCPRPLVRIVATCPGVVQVIPEGTALAGRRLPCSLDELAADLRHRA